LYKRGPIWLLVGTLVLFVLSFVFVGLRSPKVVFFPEGEPNFVYTYISLPVGTSTEYTDSITRIVEDKVYKVVGTNNPIVESVISNVAVGAGDPNDPDRSTAPHKAKVSVSFVEFAKRNGQSTKEYLDKIRAEVKGLPGVEITVDKEANGPPVGKPVNIEISGDDLDQLVKTSQALKVYLSGLQIPGVEELKSDVQNTKPDIVVEIDRERANREGISTAQIGMELRAALFGKEISKFKDANDDYSIQLRLKEDQRNNLAVLMNMELTYRDMNMGGMVRKVPLSSVANIRYANTFGGVKRKNQMRVVTLFSNVLSGYNPNEVVATVDQAVKNYNLPEGIRVDMTGEQEEQKKTGAFLGTAMLISLCLIFFILVTQFNSVSKPIIILIEILFSIIGVLLGIAIFGMEISVVMTGIGIVALAGIVVRNGILLVEFTDLLKAQGYDSYKAVIEAGKTRMTPVILTASATILGLIPLAVGLNIDFVTMFTELNPHIFFGGDSVAFWGPLSWTMIFGLSFATFLTLILVPAMYLLVDKLKMRLGMKV
jgi:multidrug efflux pump subunit AcrB